MRRRRRKGGGKQYEVVIDRIGGRGDGIAEPEEGVRLFAPLTARGDRVRLREVSPIGDGIVCEIMELLEASEDRQEAPCPHYGTCGGCQLQHLNAAVYADWKSARAHQVIERLGVAASILQPMVTIAHDTRRRVRVIAKLAPKKGASFGFRGRASHQIAFVDRCLVLDPEFESRLRAALNAFAAGLADALEVEVLANDSTTGLDLLVRSNRAPSLDERLAAGGLGQVDGVARLSWQAGREDPEILIERETPTLSIGKYKVPLSPGAFLQPSLEGEAALQALVAQGVGEEPKSIIDLFCGMGTLSLPLARGGRKIQAFDSFAPAIRALHAGQTNVDAQTRDLNRRPLLPEEFEDADCVILDPPRAGAKDQVRQLLKVKKPIPTVVYVSCNPSTFTRDAEMMIASGYQLKSLTPVDQFTWTAQLELVGIFQRN